MRGVRAKKSRKKYNLNLNLQSVYTDPTCFGFDIWENCPFDTRFEEENGHFWAFDKFSKIISIISQIVIWISSSKSSEKFVKINVLCECRKLYKIEVRKVGKKIGKFWCKKVAKNSQNVECRKCLGHLKNFSVKPPRQQRGRGVFGTNTPGLSQGVFESNTPLPSKGGFTIYTPSLFQILWQNLEFLTEFEISEEFEDVCQIVKYWVVFGFQTWTQTSSIWSWEEYISVNPIICFVFLRKYRLP